MEIRRAGCNDGDLEAYSNLFAVCFPGAKHLRKDYLRWLYVANPAGRMLGFNAFFEGRLVAHYACVPASVKVTGIKRRAILSLNTATHPDFQGRGLFTRLADQTYEAATALGIDLVFGVANAKSTQGFVRKLGFQLVAPLESRVGIGRLGTIDWPGALAAADFRRTWTQAELQWRLSNPANPVRALDLGDGAMGFSAATGRPLVRAWAELPEQALAGAIGPRPWPGGPRVFLGTFPRQLLRPAMYFRLPEALRPSPLNFIIRGLSGPLSVDRDALLVSFLDFDAF